LDISDSFITQFFLILTVKKIENWSIFDEVINRTIVSQIFWATCISPAAPCGSVAVPRTTSSLGDRSIAVAAPRAWNNLPSPLRRVHSVDTFGRQIKTFIFAQAILTFQLF